MTQWEVAYENDANDYFVEWLAIIAGTETVAQTPPRRKITDKDKANAPILAAAPELLAACEMVLELVDTQCIFLEPDEEAQLKQALARARAD